MDAAFIAASPIVYQRPLRHCRNVSRRQYSVPMPMRRAAGVTMLAKYQEKDTPESPAEDETPADSFVPPVQLPTLSTLSGIEESNATDASARNATNGDVDFDELARLNQMGLSLSKEDEFNLIQFLKESFAELRTIEWPSAGRVFKITVIVVLSIIIAAFGIYLVDGLFYSLSQWLFETEV